MRTNQHGHCDVTALVAPEAILGTVMRVGEPVRAVAMDIRHEINVFLYSKQGPPSRIGFLSTPASEQVSAQALIVKCEEACEELEGVFTQAGDGSPAWIDVRLVAHQAQTQLEHFLLYLKDQESSDGVVSGQLPVVKHAASDIKLKLGGDILLIDRIRASLAESLQGGVYESLSGVPEHGDDSGGD